MLVDRILMRASFRDGDRGELGEGEDEVDVVKRIGDLEGERESER